MVVKHDNTQFFYCRHVSIATIIATWKLDVTSREMHIVLLKDACFESHPVLDD